MVTCAGRVKWLQMLKVAGRWLTVGCMQHCLNYLAALPDAELTAATLVAVLKELPHGLDQLCNVAGWYQRCTTIAMSVPENAPERLPLAVQVISLLSRTSLPYLPLMMSVFGNVSKVLEEPELLHAFQLVPFTAVAAWAASDQLMVDSENSVAVALDVWCRGPQGSQCTGEQLRELAGLVRVCQCSQGVSPAAETSLRGLLGTANATCTVPHSYAPWYPITFPAVLTITSGT
jgi:hypothetical protein